MNIFSTILAALNGMVQNFIDYMAQRLAVGNETNRLLALIAESTSYNNFPCSTQMDEPPAGGGIPPESPDYDEYILYKCKAATIIHGGIRAFFDDAANWDWDTLATGGLSAILTGVSTLTLTWWMGIGLAAGGWIAVAGIAIAVATIILTSPLLDFADVVAILDANEEELICSLFTAANATQAKQQYMGIIDTTAISTAERHILDLILVRLDLNKLFNVNSVWSNAEIESDCTNCDPQNDTGELFPIVVTDCVLSGDWYTSLTPPDGYPPQFTYEAGVNCQTFNIDPKANGDDCIRSGSSSQNASHEGCVGLFVPSSNCGITNIDVNRESPFSQGLVCRISTIDQNGAWQEISETVFETVSGWQVWSAPMGALEYLEAGKLYRIELYSENLFRWYIAGGSIVEI